MAWLLTGSVGFLPATASRPRSRLPLLTAASLGSTPPKPPYLQSPRPLLDGKSPGDVRIVQDSPRSARYGPHHETSPCPDRTGRLRHGRHARVLPKVGTRHP